MALTMCDISREAAAGRGHVVDFTELGEHERETERMWPSLRLMPHGFAPGDRYRIGGAVQRELHRIVAPPNVLPSPGRSIEIPRIEAEPVNVAFAARPEAVGA